MFRKHGFLFLWHVDFKWDRHIEDFFIWNVLVQKDTTSKQDRKNHEHRSWKDAEHKRRPNASNHKTETKSLWSHIIIIIK